MSLETNTGQLLHVAVYCTLLLPT